MRHFFPKTTCVKSFNKLANVFFSMMAFGLLFILISSTSSFAQNTIYVDADAAAGGDGSSWSSAYNTLQDGLENAVSGDQIWVAEGSYYPDEGGGQTDNDREATFQLITGVEIYGGFEGNENNLSDRDWQANETILNGDIDGDNTSTNNSYHVVTGSDANSTAVLDGFTVTGGNADGNDPHHQGGGIFIDNIFVISSPTFAHLRITENEAGHIGGGIFSYNSSFTLFNVEISENTADYGGGIYITVGHSKLLNVSIHNNSADNDGGGINSTDDITLTNISINNNSADGDGGGFYNTGYADIQNSILWGNKAGNGAQVYTHPLDGESDYKNSLVQDNDLTGTGIGNLDGTAYTTNLIFADFSGGDYSLAPGSNAINAGGNVVYEDADGDLQNDNDLAGNPRLDAAIVDMGAYEFQGASAPPTPDGGILYVDKNVNTGVSGYDGAGDSWDNAIPKLADALKWAYQEHIVGTPWSESNPLEIWVAEGIYHPDEGDRSTDNDRNETFQLISGVKVYGGFEGNESDIAGRDWEEHVTLLSGDIDGNDNSNSHGVVSDPDDISGDNSYSVVTGSGADGTAILDGFTITAGSADDGSAGPEDPERNGGGIYNYEGAPTLTNLVITGNVTEYQGGGVYNFSSSPVLTNVTIRGNRTVAGGSTAHHGGGIANISESSVILMNSKIVGNTAHGAGGGMYNDGSPTTLINTLIAENTATSSNGGGIYSFNSTSTELINVTMSGNDAGNQGGGIFNAYNALELHNTIVWGNAADDGDGGTNDGNEIASHFGNVNFKNSLYGNDTGDIFLAGGATLNATITLNDDPQFTDASNGDYTLEAFSPALDAGNDAFAQDFEGNPLTIDQNGEPRIVRTVDMGAYEFQGEPFSIGPDDDNILYVDKNVDTGASGYDGAGDSWANAIPELADALKWARQEHDEGTPTWDSSHPLQIWVAEGTYLPLYSAADGSYTTDGGRDNAFVMLPDVELYGGFDPGNGITDLSDDRIFPTTNPGEGTILSGDLDGDDNPDDFDNHTSNAYQVVLVPDIVDSGLLDGFTMQDANGNGSNTITSFGSNFTRYKGGGVVNRGTLTVRNGCITRNRVEGSGFTALGGGVLSTGSLTLRDVVVNENHSSNKGGGLSNGDSVDLVNVLVAGNTASQGAGIFFEPSTEGILTNTTITGNAADVNGGGLFISSFLGTSIEIVNSIVWGNTASTGHNVLLSGSDITVTASNNIVGGGDGGGLNENPLFANSGSGDYTLQATSPAINAGDNGALPSGVTTDLAGNERTYNSGRVDMGAYEFQGDPETPLTLTVGEGWRMLASPIAGQSYADMLAPLWTQGVPGSDYEGDASTFPNVYTWDLTSPETCLEGDACPEWMAPPTGFENPIPAGTGFLMYVFADDDYDEGTTEGFDKTLTLTGTRHSGDVSPTINANGDGWTLVGNPYGRPVDFNELEKTDLTDAAYVYDPNLDLSPDPGPVNGNGGAWRSIAGDYGEIPSGNIAPGQGFFVQTASDPTGTPALTFSESDQTTGGEFYGKEKELRDFVRLEVQGESLYNSAWIRFSSEGALEPTTGEALELQPLSARYAMLGARKADGTLMDIAHFPLDSQDLEIPLAVQATQSGQFTIRATDLDLPAGMALYLHDRQSGQSMSLGEDFEYRFELNVEKAPKNSPLERGRIPTSGDAGVCPALIQPVQAIQSSDHSKRSDGSVANTDRFLLTTTPGAPASELPNEVALGQNYPNPFNPATVISYQLPANSQVRLEVYDMLGRNVATLVDGHVAAGAHQVNFDAGNLSSGVYLYRLQTGDAIFTKKLTLIK